MGVNAWYIRRDAKIRRPWRIRSSVPQGATLCPTYDIPAAWSRPFLMSGQQGCLSMLAFTASCPPKSKPLVHAKTSSSNVWSNLGLFTTNADRVGFPHNSTCTGSTSQIHYTFHSFLFLSASLTWCTVRFSSFSLFPDYRGLFPFEIILLSYNLGDSYHITYVNYHIIYVTCHLLLFLQLYAQHQLSHWSFSCDVLEGLGEIDRLLESSPVPEVGLWSWYLKVR